MKSKNTIAICVIFLLSVLFSNFQTVKAEGLPTPTATSLSGDANYSVQIVEQAKLPGVSSYHNLLFPSGFPLGEKQFEGAGLSLSALDYGSVSICFPLTAIRQGWGGKVGYWNGTTWDLLTTTITPAQESSLSWACATSRSNGQYAFIKWVVDASLLPKTAKAEKPYCDFAPYMFSPVPDSSPEGFDDHLILSDVNHYLFYSFDDLAGKSVKVTYVISHPKGSTTFNGIDSNFVLINGTLQTTATPGRYLIETVAPLEIVTYLSLIHI